MNHGDETPNLSDPKSSLIKLAQELGNHVGQHLYEQRKLAQAADSQVRSTTASTTPATLSQDGPRSSHPPHFIGSRFVEGFPRPQASL